MLWKQFFTPAATIDWPQAEALVKEQGALLLDVRQPREYEAEHLPGTNLLIPLGDLGNRLQELDPERTVIVY
ncbi:MAG: hypothetical protein CSA34_02745 [Desulfobulbus propionicus]|nr:MAG: hypothetical protein CSA34_02745 [Desulfobulbus propionicus]